MKVNYHTHTTRCQHALGTEEDYIKKAIANNYDKLGFSDHIPIPFLDNYVSPIRMRVEETKGYVDVLSQLKEKYKEKIQLLIGYEMEFIPDSYEKTMEQISKYGYDYLILGQHFYDIEDTGTYCGNYTEDKNRLKGYVNSVIRAMETGKFLYVAHPDILYYRQDMQYYKDCMKELAHAAKDLNIPLEYNLLGQIEEKCYPFIPFYEIVQEVGNQVIIGIDAHKPEAFDDETALQKAKKTLHDIGITPIFDV